MKREDETNEKQFSVFSFQFSVFSDISPQLKTEN